MLKLPAFRQYTDLTVFQDDERFWCFYILPGFPSVRTSPNGDPVFLLVKYALSDESREKDATLPRGGGYLVFDAELRIAEDRRTQVIADLQQYVNAEYERRRQIAQANIGPSTVSTGVTTVDPVTEGHGASGTNTLNTTMTLPGREGPVLSSLTPIVQIGEPIWRGGKVHMNAPEASGLVRKKVAEAPASLLGNNVAAFNMELTEDGATFMQGTLLGEHGEGATDLTPIQIVYDLTMLARLPPARAYVHIRLANVYHAMQEMVHRHDENGCDEDDYSTVENKLQTAIESGMIEIKIDAGGVTDDTIIKQLNTQCQALVTKVIEQKLVERRSKDGKEKGWGDDAADDEADIYRLKRETEVELTDVVQTFELDSTIEMTMHPQGTLQTFLGAADAQRMKKLVRTANLDDDFFKTLGLGVRAFANWEQDNIDYVDVAVSYVGVDENHQRVEKEQTFTFTAASRDPQAWDPALLSGQRKYTYRWRVGFKGRGPTEYTSPREETTRDLNISVETPGKLDVEVIGAGLDFAQSYSAVMVYLRYEDGARGIARDEATIALTGDKPQGTWQKMLYAPWDKPLEYRVEYILKPQGLITKDWQSTKAKKIVITDAFVDVLNVTLVPAGNWEEVQQAVISLAYEDRANTYSTDAQFELKSPDEFKQWKVVLRDAKNRNFRYRTLITYKTGAAATESAWATLTGDQAVAIRAQTTPKLKVTIMGAVVDFAQTPIVKVSLRYDDAASGTQTASFTLTKDKQVDTWSIPISDPTKTTYRYRVTYYPQNAPESVQDERSSSDMQVIVPRYDIPRAGADLSARFVDFAATPVIEVTFRYDDPQRGVHERKTLSVTDTTAQSWFLPIDAGAPRTYSYQVTYFLAPDGTPVEMPPVTTDQQKIVLPRYKAPV